MRAPYFFEAFKSNLNDRMPKKLSVSMENAGKSATRKRRASTYNGCSPEPSNMLNTIKKDELRLALEKGFDDADIAHYCELTKARVFYWRNKFGYSSVSIKEKRWEQWGRLARAGASAMAIANLYRVKENTVRLRLHLLGLSLREIKHSQANDDPYKALITSKDGRINWESFIALP